MFSKFSGALIAWMCALLVTSAASATDLPNLHQVYQATASGHYAQAQAMMDQVLQAHPNSAKAHFVEAELLAKQGQYRRADAELATAERLEPGLPFAKSQSVAELKTQLQGSHRAAMISGNIPSSNANPFPWGLLMLATAAIVLIVLLMRTLAARNTSVQPEYAAGGASNPPWAGGNTAAAPATGGIGSSLATGLATGVAVGAGMVAGEALAHHFLDKNDSGANLASSIVDTGTPASNNDMGGSDFGINDISTWDDSTSLGDSLMDSGGGDDWS